MKTKAIALFGPTGTGKTKTAIELAQKLNGEIINTDSVQIYREMNIGSAKPTGDELQKAPHHMIDILSPVEGYNTFLFLKEALKTGETISQKGKLPIFAGGTGLYFKALFSGIFEGPDRDEKVREHLKNEKEEKGLLFLYEKLKEIDPETASQISPNDFVRIERGLEVYFVTGKVLSKHRKEQNYESPFEFLKIGLTYPRETLYERINQRIDIMIESGLLGEVKKLMEKYPDSHVLNHAIGYKEPLLYLKGELPYDQMVSNLKQNSRRFAKRQMTLFRALKEVHWFCPPDTQAVFSLAVKFLS